MGSKFPKVGLFGILGGLATIVGFQADIVPETSYLDNQGALPPAKHDKSKTQSTLYLINSGENVVRDLKYYIVIDGKEFSKGHLEFLDAGRHEELFFPVIRKAASASVCSEFTETVYGFIPLKRTATWQMRPEKVSYSDFYGLKTVMREETGLLRSLVGTSCG